MYNSVAELHIGLDLALQQLNSNRKQVLKPEEKDWFFNNTILQVINNHIDPNASLPTRGSDSDQRSMDFLSALKTDNVDRQPVFYNSAANLYSIALPPDYHRRIRINCDASLNIKESVNNVVIEPNNKLVKIIVPFDEIGVLGQVPVLSDYINNTSLTISGANITLFNSNTKTSNNSLKQKYDFSNIKTIDAKFMMIPTILEEANKVKGAFVYWENYKGYNYKNSFVVIIDKNVIPLATDVVLKIGSGDTFRIVNTPTVVNGTVIKGGYSKQVPCRIVESAEFDTINDNFFFQGNYHRLVSTIEHGEIIVAGIDYLKVTDINLTYYRKPKLINYKTGQACEIDADDFKSQLVNLTAQKIDAFLSDENYQKVINENIMLL